MIYFKDWFFRQFPRYHQVNDTYKNVDGQGILQRYLRVYGDELDQNFVPYIENFLDIIDYIKCEDKFLPLIGSILGYPPSINGLPETYRKILAYCIAIYKVKGNCTSYEILFNIFGMEVEIEMDTPQKKLTYDPFPNITYDEDPTPYRYDSDCEYCTNYMLKVRNINGSPLDPNLLTKIQSIICWIEPINARLLGIEELPPEGILKHKTITL